MPVIERPWTDLSQGTLQPTGNPLDLALIGQGLFRGAGAQRTALHAQRQFPSGGRRDSWSPAEGYPVQRRPAARPDRCSSARPIEISGDGTVRQDGNVIGQLQVVGFHRHGRAGQAGQQLFSCRRSRSRSPRRPPAPRWSRANWKRPTAAPPNRPCGWSASCGSSRCCRRPLRWAADMSKQAIEQVAKVGS